jgi:hypothetical protein
MKAKTTEGYSIGADLMEESAVSSHNASNCKHLSRVDASKGRFLDRFLFCAKPIAEYAFGIHMGFAAGWLLGVFAGSIYAEYSPPEDFCKVCTVSQWGVIAHEFVINGAVLGVVTGVIGVSIINGKLLKQRVLCLWKKGIRDPQEISRILCKSETQITKLISKLMQTRELSAEKIGVGRQRVPAQTDRQTRCYS